MDTFFSRLKLNPNFLIVLLPSLLALCLYTFFYFLSVIDFPIRDQVLLIDLLTNNSNILTIYNDSFQPLINSLILIDFYFFNVSSNYLFILQIILIIILVILFYYSFCTKPALLEFIIFVSPILLFYFLPSKSFNSFYLLKIQDNIILLSIGLVIFSLSKLTSTDRYTKSYIVLFMISVFINAINYAPAMLIAPIFSFVFLLLNKQNKILLYLFVTSSLSTLIYFALTHNSDIQSDIFGAAYKSFQNTFKFYILSLKILYPKLNFATYLSIVLLIISFVFIIFSFIKRKYTLYDVFTFSLYLFSMTFIFLAFLSRGDAANSSRFFFWSQIPFIIAIAHLSYLISNLRNKMIILYLYTIFWLYSFLFNSAFVGSLNSKFTNASRILSIIGTSSPEINYFLSPNTDSIARIIDKNNHLLAYPRLFESTPINKCHVKYERMSMDSFHAKNPKYMLLEVSFSELSNWNSSIWLVDTYSQKGIELSKSQQLRLPINKKLPSRVRDFERDIRLFYSFFQARETISLPLPPNKSSNLMLIIKDNENAICSYKILINDKI